jgi:mercuric ion binding protein
MTEYPMAKLPASLAIIASLLISSGAFATEKTITLAVQHMTCAACPGTVKASLQAVPGVTNVVVSFEDKTAVVNL